MYFPSLQVQAVYQPAMELILLVQFFCFWHDRRECIYLCAVFASAVVLTVGLESLPVHDIASKLQWIAIFLWSVETIPQVVLNIRRDTHIYITTTLTTCFSNAIQMYSTCIFHADVLRNEQVFS